MRLVLAFSVFALLAACSGDSSSVMSTWDDDTGGARGGSGGRAAGGQSGSPGKGGSGGSGGAATTTIPTGGMAGNVTVPGGVRDAVTAQCISTSSGGGCPLDSTSLQCWTGPCGAYVTACFQGTSGPCAAYAACLFKCPCDSTRSDCELTCLRDKGMGDEKCSPFVNDLGVCLSANNCIRMACLVN